MLTYCTNIHPGESWADVLGNLEAHTLTVKEAVSPDEPFPIGLRLSGRAANEIDPVEAKRFREWCEARDCFVLTVNGFPHGQFHGTGVKEKVYAPDWREPERVEYTMRLADLLAEWLPAGVAGSISTVPVAHRHGFAPSSGDWDVVARHVREVAQHLERLRQDRGVEIVLAFEPEPRCVLETTPEAVAMFERLALPGPLADLVGVCFDCCHQAVEFETPAASLELLENAGIPVGKVQVSSALCARGDEVEAVCAFDEPTYLHQVVARGADGDLHRYDDLPDFGPSEREGVEECRVHFHVPIFADHLGSCGTTRFFLEDVLPRLDPALPLEVETYSWDVLPAYLRTGRVADSVIRELRWVRGQLGRD